MINGCLQTKEGASKKAVKALRDELTKSDTALPMLYLIAQVMLQLKQQARTHATKGIADIHSVYIYLQIRSKIIFGVQTTQLKLVSHMYDICQDVLVQFTEFLVQGGVTLSGSASEKMKVFEALAGISPFNLSCFLLK